jgi:salicylate biosynthesis isochorismate synthase/menaquinone-specific isochorismate synthase
MDTGKLAHALRAGGERTELASRIKERIEAGLLRARRTGRPVLVSVTAPIRAEADPTAIVAASRRRDEHWFCLEQPDRDRAAIAALGCARELEAAGPNRFGAVAASWREATAAAVSDPCVGPPGAGLTAVGGFAFAADGGDTAAWDGFAPASLIVPELCLARRSGETSLTVNVDVAPDDSVEELVAGVEERLSELRDDELPLLDPAPTGTYRVNSAMPPAHYEEAVARAVQRIRDDELAKVVLARDVEVLAPTPHDPAAVLGVLREAFSSCFVFAVGRGDATFIAASPELLLRLEGQRASTVALAGSTRRSADPAVDAHLGEQLLRSDKDRDENAIVARRIVQTLRPHAVWVTAAPEPVVVQVANIQHLARPIRAQLTHSLDAVELVSLLHPTPAVGGEPWVAAEPLIPSLEGLDRGWYAGAVGWTDATGDGEFCVALRCAIVRGRHARCYAGCGIVRDSVPASELAETEVKLQALLPVLTG